MITTIQVDKLFGDFPVGGQFLGSNLFCGQNIFSFQFLVAKIFVLFCFWPKSWPNLDLWQGGGGTPVSAYHIRDQRADGDEYGDDDEDDDVQEEGDDDPCVRPWRHSWPDSEWVAIGEISPIL